MDNMNYNQQMNQPLQNPKAPWFVTYLILSILELFCCNQITGVIALVFIIMGNSAYQAGQMLDAENKRKTAKLSLIIGLILGILIYIAVIIIYFVVGLAAFGISNY